MKRSFALLALTVGMFGTANAESQSNVADARLNPLATPWSRPVPSYRFVDPGLTNVDESGAALASSNVVFLNRCVGGCTISPGNENAVNNRSSIVDRASTISQYSGSEANWNAIVQCVRETYAPFNVQIVTERPTSGIYHMAIVAGRPTEVGFDNGTLGVSPYTCGYISGGISFSFANVIPNDVAEMCWTVSQETAHSWGLDHKFDNKDPMTYLQNGPAKKTFQNTTGSCGEYEARNCSCGGATMNSYTEVLATFGPNGPAVPPVVAISSPTNGSTVQAQFPIRAEITDDISVSKAELYIDGQLIGAALTAQPWVWNAPASLQQGGHQVKVIGYDIGGATAEQVVSVVFGAKCSDDNKCATATDACVDGRCVVGQGVDGGLGTACVGAGECASNQCASDGTDKYCVESCDPEADGCPSGFGCIVSGSSGVCWPGAGGDDGGCSTGSSRDGALLIGLGLGAMLLARRRRA